MAIPSLVVAAFTQLMDGVLPAFIRGKSKAIVAGTEKIELLAILLLLPPLEDTCK